MAVYQAEVEALYFDTRETGVSYAIVNERVLNPNFNQRFGARAKVGVQLGEDCWELGLQFLHYHARTRTEEKGVIFPTWGRPAQYAGPVDNASSLWRLHLGFLDGVLSKNWWVSPSLELTPILSLRYAEIRHKLQITYDSEWLCFKNKFWSGGPGIGIEGLWHVFDCIGLYSRGAFHLVYGKFYIHQDIGALKLFNEFWQTQGMFESALGVDVKWCQLTARIGWELHLLLGQNQLMRFVDDGIVGRFVTNLGDLSMQGLTFGLSLEF